MTSDPEVRREELLDDAEAGDGLPDEAPEADVLEQRLSPGGYDPEAADAYDVPAEADAADVREQHRSAGDDDGDDYR